MTYVVIKNIGAVEGVETNQTVAYTGVGDVTLTLEGKVYHWGVGESKSLPEPLASQALAANELLIEVSRS